MNTLILDLDNTLVECAPYYRQAVEAAADAIHGSTAVHRSYVIESIDLADKALIATRGVKGFKLERFGDAILQGAQFAERISGRACVPTPNALRIAALNTIMSAPYTPLPRAIDTLLTYRRAGWRLMIWSKGEDWLQREKIDKNGLGAFFDPLDIVIVPVKTPDRLRAMVDQYRLDPQLTVMVGDSYRDEIQAALAVGMHAVHIAGDYGPPGYEVADAQHARSITGIGELVNVLSVDGWWHGEEAYTSVASAARA